MNEEQLRFLMLGRLADLVAEHPTLFYQQIIDLLNDGGVDLTAEERTKNTAIMTKLNAAITAYTDWRAVAFP